MKVRNQKDFAAGATFLAIGAAFAIVAQNYQMGTAARMGPGYFPFGLSVMLMFFGAVTVLRSFASGAEADRLTRWNFKGIVFVLGAVVLFAALLKTVGVVASIVIAVLFSRLADRVYSIKGSVGTAVVVSVICVLGFVYGLGLQLHIWPPFLTAHGF